MHAVGEFEGLESGFEFLVLGAGGGVVFVEFFEEIELAALAIAVEEFGGDVVDELARVFVFGVDVGALVGGGEEASLPVLGAGNGVAATASAPRPMQLRVRKSRRVPM